MKGYVELKEFPNYFIAHSPARLMRLKGDKYIICKQTPNSSNKNDYWTVTLKTREGKYVKRSMHRLLMQTFVPNPDNKAHINHIDGDKSNNDLDNLEWATPKENAQHAHKTRLVPADLNTKPVHQYYLNGQYIRSFNSDIEAERETGIAKQNISKATLGKRKHAGYFQWLRDKKESIKPLENKYIKSYELNGVLYNTVREIAQELGLKNPDKVNLPRLPKEISESIKINYYE